ncbi:MAG: NAD(P)H-binding protein, partial [Actinobacteria bacterium]|nr:NAD(P)H-binding protein [Actinomycetota bacterium]
MRVLVTGATGYIGGRLIPQLLDRGHEVRVLARHPDRLSERSWADRVEVFSGDATDPQALAEAMAGMDGAYYLMHSLTAGHGFEDQERAMATVFARCAEQAGVKRIVYLGGMVPDVPPRKLSAHLRSRAEVGCAG